MSKNLILVGLGPYTKKSYINFIKNNCILLSYVIELRSKETSTIAFLKKNGFFNTSVYLIDDKYRDDISLNENDKKNLSIIIKNNYITHAIISTEPKAHYSYLKFFLEEKINVLVEKPVVITKGLSYDSSARELMIEHMNEICKLYQKNYNELNISVMCQRRYSDVYLFIKNYISDIIKKYDIGITNMHISTCDGMWNMPDEFYYRENHPYKYGYGKIMHSGYHFVDLLLYLLEENKKLINKKITGLRIKSSAVYPSDSFRMINSEDYKTLFHTSIDYEEDINKMNNQFGEIDVHSILDFVDDENHILTSVSMDMLQSGFSRRAWTDLPEDTYKSNGRIKHSFIEINLGPLVSIKILAFQALLEKEGNKGTELGKNDHFEIQIYRNAQLIGGKVLEVFNIEDFTDKSEYFLGYNELYRERLFLDFLAGNKGKSDLLNHKSTMNLVKNLYDSLEENQLIPFSLEGSE